MTATAPLSNIEIAQRATMKPIVPLGMERLGIPEEHLHPFGRYKAKLALDYCEHVNGRLANTLGMVYLVIIGVAATAAIPLMIYTWMGA